MALFQFPKEKHARSQRPRAFRQYRSYKPFVRREFSRVCVYCRAPDTLSDNLNYGVDHYRPKSHPRFARLLVAYDNLYYCCGLCNSRKSDYWPVDERAGPYVLNPCEHRMADHLRYVAETGKIETRSANGEFHSELLQLNTEAMVRYRHGLQVTIGLHRKELGALSNQLKALKKKRAANDISEDEYTAECDAVAEDMRLHEECIARFEGSTPLPPVKSKVLGVSLTK